MEPRAWVQFASAGRKAHFSVYLIPGSPDKHSVGRSPGDNFQQGRLGTPYDNFAPGALQSEACELQ